jgi:hypothetical protein
MMSLAAAILIGWLALDLLIAVWLSAAGRAGMRVDAMQLVNDGRLLPRDRSFDEYPVATGDRRSGRFSRTRSRETVRV